jgi:hypothetical protein
MTREAGMTPAAAHRLDRNELAQRLSREMQRVRLERIGEPLPEEASIAELGPDEVRNWLDLADVVLRIFGDPHGVIDAFIAEVVNRQPWKGLADFAPRELDFLSDTAIHIAGVSSGAEVASRRSAALQRAADRGRA